MTTASAQSGRQASLETSDSIYHCKDEPHYDRYTGVTTVICGLVKQSGILRSSSGTLYVNIIASFTGEKPGPDTKLYFALSHMDSTPRLSVYENADTFFVLTDKDRFQLPIMDYKNQRPNLLTLEDAKAELAGENLRTLVEAKTLEARWWATEIKFTVEAVEGLKDFIKRYGMQEEKAQNK